MNIGILASVYGYGPEQIKPWVESLKATKFGGKVFVVVYNPQDSILLDYLKENGIFTFTSELNGDTNMATQRFLEYSEILKSEYTSDVDAFIATDIRDVIFQSDPGVWLKNNIQDYDLVATSEGVTFRHEDWNGDNLELHLGKNLFLKLADKETLCSGIIAGKKEMLIKLFQTVYELAFFSADPGAFVDQIFYAAAIYEVFAERTKIVPASDNWCANLGTIKAIPESSQDWSMGSRSQHNSFERIRKVKTFNEALSCAIPTMENGKVVNEKKQPYVIVHQYDRYQPWKKEIHSNYGIVEMELVNYQDVITEDATIVQIGSHDGIEGEEYGLKETLDRLKSFKLFLIEPLPKYFDKLKDVYAKWESNIVFSNCAITEADGNFMMVDQGGMSKITDGGNILVSGVSWKSFTAIHDLAKVDFLMLDCEGYEDTILKSIDYDTCDISCIRFEYFHIQDKLGIDEFLKSKGYVVNLCVKDPSYNKIAIKK